MFAVFTLSIGTTSDQATLIKRQVAALTSRGLDGQIASSEKVNLLEADFGKPDLGLCDAVLHEVGVVCPNKSVHLTDVDPD